MKVQLNHEEIRVQDGWFWGFTWKDYGVVSFSWSEKDVNDPAKNRNYCGDIVKPNIGEYHFDCPFEL